jgi:hypothetical protein
MKHEKLEIHFYVPSEQLEKLYSIDPTYNPVDLR